RAVGRLGAHRGADRRAHVLTVTGFADDAVRVGADDPGAMMAPPRILGGAIIGMLPVCSAL
ncbi:MAG: hypothetical protein L0H93_17705, partial [Nocardioides sp.]|nr:hypothetical protein [Nocardioides sp.]